MKRIGIDFGTTNSTIAYLDNNSRPVGFRFGGPNGNEYIPSAIAYSKNDDTESPLIGDEAKHKQNSDEYYYFEHYKLKLIYKYDLFLEKCRKKVIDITKDYLRQLIAKYKREAFNSGARPEKLDYIALALPNAVYSPNINNERDVQAAERIKQELSELLESEAESYGFYSESTCACQFYVNNYEIDFSGNIIVIDYGGGTLDISSCKVARYSNVDYPIIEVLAQVGTSTDELGEFSSYAGVQFDRAVVSNFYVEDTAAYASYVGHFESSFKIPQSNQLNQKLIKYYDTGVVTNEEWRPEIAGNPHAISAELLDDVFSQYNLPKLRQYFYAVVPEEGLQDGGATIQSSFRVLLIGGFSQLYCVENYVRDFLNIDKSSLHDKRLTDVNANEKFLAVAYGAAIEAERSVLEVASHASLHEIGVKAFDGSAWNNNIIVDENERFEDSDIVWSSRAYYVLNGKSANINLYCSTSVSGESDVYPADISGVCTDNCNIMLGCSISGGSHFLHARNVDNDRQITIDISGMIAAYRSRDGR